MAEKHAELLEQCGAALVAADELTGAMTARSFGDPGAEYAAIRSDAALLDRLAQSLLRIEGTDCRKFLQGYVTNDVMMLAPGKGRLCGIASQTGKSVADCRVYSLEESLLIECDATARPQIIQHLGKYAPFSKSKIEDVSELFGVLSVQGPKARALLEALASESMQNLEWYDHQLLALGSAKLQACRISHTGEDGYDLIVPCSELSHVWKLLSAGRGPMRATPAGAEAAEVARIEAAIPRFGIDFDESNVFLESGLDDAVSYAKGCYLGQEIIARIYFRGHVSKRLATIVLESDPPPHRDDRVFSGEKEAGRITSACHSPALGRPLAFAMLKHEFLDRGTTLELRTAGRLAVAEVVRAPFGWERTSIEPPKDFVAKIMPVK